MPETSGNQLGATQPVECWSLRFLLKAYATQHTGFRVPGARADEADPPNRSSRTPAFAKNKPTAVDARPPHYATSLPFKALNGIVLLRSWLLQLV